MGTEVHATAHNIYSIFCIRLNWNKASNLLLANQQEIISNEYERNWRALKCVQSEMGDDEFRKMSEEEINASVLCGLKLYAIRKRSISLSAPHF